jgi:hypothetical protein
MFIETNEIQRLKKKKVTNEELHNLSLPDYKITLL